MRKIIVTTSLLACAALLFGCPKKAGDGGDAAADGASEAEAPAAVADAAAAPIVVNAKNSASVARFPGETALTDDDEKLASPGYPKTAPKSGALVATIPTGAGVTKIAEYQGSILVSFADPKDASSTLMGWIEKTAFTAIIVKKLDGGVLEGGVKDAAAPVVEDAGPAKKLTCPMGMVAVILTKDPTCRKKCTKDSDCKGGAAGGCANAQTAAGGVAKVCTVGE